MTKDRREWAIEWQTAYLSQAMGIIKWREAHPQKEDFFLPGPWLEWEVLKAVEGAQSCSIMEQSWGCQGNLKAPNSINSWLNYSNFAEWKNSSSLLSGSCSWQLCFFLLVLLKLRVEGGEMKSRASEGAPKGLPGKDLWSLKLPILARSQWEY